MIREIDEGHFQRTPFLHSYEPQRMPNNSATLVLSSGTGGESVWCKLTINVLENAIVGPT